MFVIKHLIVELPYQEPFWTSVALYCLIISSQVPLLDLGPGSLSNCRSKSSMWSANLTHYSLSPCEEPCEEKGSILIGSNYLWQILHTPSAHPNLSDLVAHTPTAFPPEWRFVLCTTICLRTKCTKELALHAFYCSLLSNTGCWSADLCLTAPNQACHATAGCYLWWALTQVQYEVLPPAIYKAAPLPANTTRLFFWVNLDHWIRHAPGVYGVCSSLSLDLALHT